MNATEERQSLAEEVKLLGFELIFTSDYGSEYFHRFFKNKSTIVRISDHMIPETEERMGGRSCYDYELLYNHGFEDDNKETLDFLRRWKNEAE